MIKKLAIIGQGYVGKAFKKFVEKHFEVVTYDPAVNSAYDKKLIDSCDLGVICVPTPPREDGSCDTSIVEECVKKLNTPIILIKSTVTPGTTDKLAKKYKKKICFSPEFVGESKYYHPYWMDMVESPYAIFGGDEEISDEVIAMHEVIMGPTKVYYKCRAIEAEVIKYLENSFFAAKVTICNEFYSICEVLGANWYKVREGWLLDPRINKMHTSVFKSNRGYGGKCYPKDISALVQVATKAGYEPKLLKQVIKSNEYFRKLNK